MIIYLPLGGFGATFYIDTDIPFYISYVWWLPKKQVLFHFEIAHVSWLVVQQLAPKQAGCLSRDAQDPLKYEEVQQNHTVVARHT